MVKPYFRSTVVAVQGAVKKKHFLEDSIQLELKMPLQDYTVLYLLLFVGSAFLNTEILKMSAF